MIEYNRESKSIVDNSTVVMYCEDINSDVAVAVVNMWNDSLSIKEIDQRLYKDFADKCTTEEQEYIVEQLENYQKLSRIVKTEKVEITTIEIPTPGDSDVNVDTTGKGANLSTAVQIPKTRRRVTQTPAGNGKVSATSVVEKLKAQAETAQKLILMVDYLEQTTTGDDFPDGLKTEQIQLLVKFTKSIAEVKSTYLQQIQEL